MEDGMRKISGTTEVPVTYQFPYIETKCSNVLILFPELPVFVLKLKMYMFVEEGEGKGGGRGMRDKPDMEPLTLLCILLSDCVLNGVSAGVMG